LLLRLLLLHLFFASITKNLVILERSEGPLYWYLLLLLLLLLYLLLLLLLYLLLLLHLPEGAGAFRPLNQSSRKGASAPGLCSCRCLFLRKPEYPLIVILSEAQRSRRTCHTANPSTLFEPFNHRPRRCCCF